MQLVKIAGIQRSGTANNDPAAKHAWQFYRLAISQNKEKTEQQGCARDNSHCRYPVDVGRGVRKGVSPRTFLLSLGLPSSMVSE